jgi:hypothetical protein
MFFEEKYPNAIDSINVFLITAKHANEVLTDINRLMEI